MLRAIVCALAIAREEIALTSSCGVRRRRLSSASPAIDEWPPRSRSRPDRRRQLNHVPLPTTWALNDVYVIYAAQKMPGNVLSPEMLLEIQSIEARIRATPGFKEHCAVRHDDHASYSAGPRVCALVRAGARCCVAGATVPCVAATC